MNFLTAPELITIGGYLKPFKTLRTRKTSKDQGEEAVNSWSCTVGYFICLYTTEAPNKTTGSR